MVTTTALTGGPMFTTVALDGVTHTRSSFAKADACPAPDWVSRIGSAGGEHSIATCPKCWLQAIVKARWEADGTADQWREADDTFLQKLSTLQPESYTLTADELDYLRTKQSERYRRVALHAPIRRLPALLREMRTLAAVISRQLSTGKLSQTQSNLTLMRYYDVQRAASIAWERLKDACDDTLTLYRLRAILPPSNPYMPTNWS